MYQSTGNCLLVWRQITATEDGNFEHGIFSDNSIGIDNRLLRWLKHCSSIKPGLVISPNYRLETRSTSGLSS